MYQSKASKGVRVGAYFLDGLFLSILLLLTYLISPVLFLIVSMAGTFLYYGIFEGSGMQGTPGKYLCGLKVVDAQGQPLGFGKSFLRALCRVLSGAIFGIGFLMGLLDENGRTLHDRLAGTMVVKREETAAGNGYVQPELSGSNQFVREEQNMSTEQPQLVGVTGQFAGRSFPVSVQGIMMGRDQTACDFVFPDNVTSQGVSRVHCKVRFNPQTRMFILYDLGSSYGTFLGSGVRVSQEQPAALRAGEEFYLASRAITFRVELAQGG